MFQAHVTWELQRFAGELERDVDGRACYRHSRVAGVVAEQDDVHGHIRRARRSEVVDAYPQPCCCCVVRRRRRGDVSNRDVSARRIFHVYVHVRRAELHVREVRHEVLFEPFAQWR